jgi:hypothetical protein
MKYILLLLLLLCFGFIVYLILENRKIKKRQLQNINKMQTLIMSLHQQQLYLNDKVFISSEYDFNYRKKIKNLSTEIVELQNVFLEIISNR